MSNPTNLTAPKPANPFAHRPSRSGAIEKGVLGVFRAATYLILLCGAIVFADIVFKGVPTVVNGFKTTANFPYVTNTFLFTAPESLYVFDFEGKSREMGDQEFRAFRATEEAKATAAGQPVPAFKATSYVYSAGGIWPCIVGTVLLVVGSMTIALFLGVSSAIFLNEYAKDGPVVRFIRLAILNLAGVPSIVFGLFGFGMFVIFCGWNVSLLSGWFTLAFMVLPVVITASEEALKAVPKGFREGSLALGATKWQTIRKNVVPYALPGILTSSILGIARVAGETAPIMFTAAYVVRDKLPWDVEKASDFFFQGVMALPYHIYVVSSKIPQNEYTARVQYGTAFVFLGLVALIATASIILRNNLRGRYKW
ncbi:MAG: phosphate ABC transporter permease PstA [Opitutus sp.]|nr:phosphate ABC transporter permease PstA [Opitutus sp.]MCS6247542.1 phosphate ABC transporter permease PstA [Opitutus sp.]MCS6274470.1 phosphate ABC transporter permease PstA [Opitutus sp.]MCS6277639.1 phosphate ABC transporter permease PstA [Opitutus sp.]MCS6300757.1 phosphate ABC transporter permease PstA [Opitutus sp.]